MPSLRTETSELAVAFGILGIDPEQELTEDQTETFFEGTLSRDKYSDFVSEYPRNIVYRRMHQVGRDVRSNVSLLQHIESLRWSGPARQASTISAAADLYVANVPISVKAKSNVVANPSLYNLIHNVSLGRTFSKNEDHWYVEQDPSGYQTLYSFVRDTSPGLVHLPVQVADFERRASADDRRFIRQIITSYSDATKRTFQNLYVNMCHRVARSSSGLFNQNIATSMESRARTATIEYLMRWFFRMNAIRYILCGIDGADTFAVEIPTLTEWKAAWNLSNITSSPATNRRQSVVCFHLIFERRETGESHTTQFHTELRWSHGRFCGAPEGKLYKDFSWVEVPFFRSLI